MKQRYVIVLEVDSAYDDLGAFHEDLQQAVNNEEEVSVHVAGTHYSTGVTSIDPVTSE